MPTKAISIHAPRVGSDSNQCGKGGNHSRFLSTLPAWGATACPYNTLDGCKVFLSTLPAWGATSHEKALCPLSRISIHAPRVGSDPSFPDFFVSPGIFLSTLPAWGATHFIRADVSYNIFLSTLPAWGATPATSRNNKHNMNFYPRSPRGERLCFVHIVLFAYNHFYPRSPRGERLIDFSIRSFAMLISIHAPRVGSDRLNLENLGRQ